MKSSLFLVLIAAGCSDDVALSTTSAPLTVVSHDCDLVAGSELDSYTPALGGIGLVGIFKPRSNDLPGYEDPSCTDCLDDPTCDVEAHCNFEPPVQHPAAVHLSGSATTWVLSAAMPTLFTVTADPDAAVERIVVTGVAGVEVTAPANIPVEVADLGVGWDWYSDEELAALCAADSFYCTDYVDGNHWFQEMQSRNLVGRSERYVGDSLSAFYGCFAMSSMVFGSR